MLIDDILDDDDLELPEGEDVFYPGDFDKDIADSLQELTESLQSMQDQLDQADKTGQRQFIIATVISLFGLIAAVTTAVAAVIPLL